MAYDSATLRAPSDSSDSRSLFRLENGLRVAIRQQARRHYPLKLQEIAETVT